MPGQDLLISDFDVGLERDKEPFLLPEKAFPTLEDAYIYRGRVERRFGFVNQGRLRRVFGATVITQTIAVGVQTTIADLLADATINLRVTEPNGEIQTGSVIITEAGGSSWNDATTNGVMTDTGGAAAAGTINYATGAIVLNFTGAQGGGAAITVTFNYFPSLPVMGLRTREQTTINQEQSVGFDTKYAYQFTAPNGWEDLPSTLTTTWNGTDSEFFWTTNYRGSSADSQLFWETNGNDGLHGFAVTLFGVPVIGPPSLVTVTAAGNTFQVGDTVYFLNLAGAGAANNLLTGTVTIAGDPIFTISNTGTNIYTAGVVTGLVLSGNRNTNGDGIRYYNGTTWTNFNPAINATTALMGCEMLYPFKDRLFALNTQEGNSLVPTSTRFPQRLRFSQNGDPTNLTLGWREDVVGRGGFIDAATSEEIVSAQFVKDRLIVFFERSTWEIVYTGNELLPFVWQKINTELGAESKFSEVPFDDGILGIGNTGIHIANSQGVERIDMKIPDEVGSINNDNNGTARVYGIRDFDKELVYWSFPSFVGDPTYPNRVIVYNYRNNTFAIFNDRFTCYGYFQRITDYTWATLPYSSWTSWNVPWNAAVGQSFFQQIIAGNQQGFTQLFDYSSDNDETLSVTAIAGATVTSPNHNLQIGQYVTFTSLTGIVITPIAPNTTQTFIILTVPTANTFTIDGTAAGTYPGGGTITVLNNINITTKNFDFATQIGQDNFLNYIEFLFSRTENGEVTLELFQDFNTAEPLDPLYGTKAIRTRPEDNDSFSQNQNKIWHKAARPLIGDSFQAQLILSDDQMRDSDIQTSPITLHAMLLNVEATGRLK